MDEEIPPLVSATDWAKTPPDVRQAFVSLVDMVRELSAQVQELRALLKQTSHNSSKPPSSDPPSAPPAPAPRVARGRKRGGQPGHPDQQRPLLPEDQLDAIVALRPTSCSHCQAALAPELPLSGPIWVYQIWELPPLKPTVTEYQQQAVCCPACQQTVTADLPPEVPPGAFGPRLSALIGLLHGGYHLSMRTTAALLEDVCGLRVSLGSVATSCARVSAVLAPIDATIQNYIQQQPQLWVDETGWKEGARRGWLWVAVSPQASCYRIHASRGQGALWELLGEAYGGVVHSDRASVYHALPNRQRQLCWAHIIRNLQGLAEYQHAESRWAGALLDWTRPLFDAYQAYQCGIFDQIALQHALLPVRLAMHDLLLQGARAPWEKLQATCTDLLRHWEALWTFSRVEGLEPTNNRAERALRPAVIWRKSCYGTQSEGGSRFVERMLSVQATCAQQGRNLFAFLSEAVRAAWALESAPVLISTS
jgi:transposase